MSFKTLLACVLCQHSAVIDPPAVHPQCPKCGGPVRLKTAEEGSPELTPAPTAPAVGDSKKLTAREAFAELHAFVVGLAERVDEEARDLFAMLGEQVRETAPHELQQLAEQAKRDAASNVHEVIAKLDEPIAKAAGVGPEPDAGARERADAGESYGGTDSERDPELPPGSA